MKVLDVLATGKKAITAALKPKPSGRQTRSAAAEEEIRRREEINSRNSRRWIQRRRGWITDHLKRRFD